MGNALRKPEYMSMTVDGGRAQVKEPTRLPDNADIRTRIAAANEYDPRTVAKLIESRRLAPFYEAASDETANGPSGSNADRASILTTESRRRAAASKKKKHEVGRSNGGFLAFGGNHKRKKGKEPKVFVDKAWLTTSLQECPICLMWYPRNMNWSKCCKKPICTLCFVSMKRPSNTQRLIGCPFCRANNFTVMYKPPEAILSKGGFKRGVSCEQIRPARIIPAPQPSYRYYYTGTGSRNVSTGLSSPTFARPSIYAPTATTSGRFVFYPGNRPAGPAFQPRFATTSAQTSNRAGSVGSGAASSSGLRMTQEEARTYEERALSRAIRLSMLEY